MRLSEMDARDWNEHEPENPVVETETSEYLTRYTYKDGSIGWKACDRYLTDTEQDAYGEAYEMGRRSNETQMANLRANAKAGRDQAFADGVFVTAQTVHGGKR